MNKVKDFFKKIALFFKSLFVSVNGKEPKLLTLLKKIGKFFKGLFVKVDDKKPGFARLYEKPCHKIDSRKYYLYSGGNFRRLYNYDYIVVRNERRYRRNRRIIDYIYRSVLKRNFGVYRYKYR